MSKTISFRSVRATTVTSRKPFSAAAALSTRERWYSERGRRANKKKKKGNACWRRKKKGHDKKDEESVDREGPTVEEKNGGSRRLAPTSAALLPRTLMMNPASAGVIRAKSPLCPSRKRSLVVDPLGQLKGTLFCITRCDKSMAGRCWHDTLVSVHRSFLYTPFILTLIPHHSFFNLSRQQGTKFSGLEIGR